MKLEKEQERDLKQEGKYIRKIGQKSREKRLTRNWFFEKIKIYRQKNIDSKCKIENAEEITTEIIDTMER